MFITSSWMARYVRKEVACSVVLSVATPLSLLSTCWTGVDPAIWRGTQWSARDKHLNQKHKPSGFILTARRLAMSKQQH